MVFSIATIALVPRVSILSCFAHSMKICYANFMQEKEKAEGQDFFVFHEK